MVEFGLNLLSQMKSQTYLKMIGISVDTIEDNDRNDGNNSNLKKISFNFIKSLFLWITICYAICVLVLIFELIYKKIHLIFI